MRQEILISVPEAARLLGMSPRWMHREIEQGAFKACRPGKHLRIWKRDVLAFRAARTQQGDNGANVIIAPSDTSQW